MSGGTKTTTQDTSTEPWDAAQPTIKTALSGANDIYADGSAWQPNTASMVVPFAEQTTQGMQGVMDVSQGATGANNLAGNAYSQMNNAVNQGGLSDYQIGVGNQWQNTASGAELNNTSPAFNAVLDRMQRDTGTMTDIGMSGMGRYGSGAHGKAAAGAIGDVTNRMLDSNYGRELGRMDQARTGLAGLGQQGLSNISTFGSQSGDMLNQQLAPYQNMMKVGSMYEDLAARTLQDQNRIYDQTRQAPLAAVEWLNAIGGGAGSLGGTGSNAVAQPTPNPFLQVATSLAGPIGQAMLGASDIRLKTDIQQIGNLTPDIPIYKFSYVWGGPEYTGVMAQDVIKTRPDAVHMMDTGYYAVDYNAIGTTMQRVGP
jgi:hypothetical protein